MSDIETIGLALQTDGVERGIRSLDELAARGPKVEKSLKGVETAATDAGKGVSSLGASNAKGLDDVARAGDRAAQGLRSTGEAARSAVSSQQALAAAVSQFTSAERSYVQSLVDEYKQLSMNKGERAAYIAQAKGMSSAAQDVARAVGQKIDAYKREQEELAKTQSSMEQAKRLAAGIFSGLTVTAAVTKLVSVQREFDVLNSSLKTVTGSSAAAEREMAWLKDFAKETPFGLAQATQGFVKMKALGLDPTRASLTSFGNTASAMGKDLNQMIEAVADASTGEFERLKEFGIKAKKEGDNVSLTFQGVTTTIKNSAAEITSYLEQIGNNQFGGAMEERAKTLDGAIAGLGDTWDELFRTVNERSAGTLIHDSIKLATGAIEDATTTWRAMTAAANDASSSTSAVSVIQNGIATVFETVAVLGVNVAYVLEGVGREVAALAAQAAQAAQFNFAGVRAIREQVVEDAEAARREVDATTSRILNARKEQQEYARWATRNASAANDPRRLDLPSQRNTSSSASSERKSAIDSEARAYKSLTESLREKIAAEQAELSGGAKLSENQKLRIKYAEDLQGSLKGINAAQRSVIEGYLDEHKAAEQANVAAREAMKSAQEIAAARNREAAGIDAWIRAQEDAARQSLKSVQDRIHSMEDEARPIELSHALNVSLAEAIELVAIARLEEKQAGFYEGSQGWEAIQREINARRELLGLIGSKEAREANKRAADEAAKDWERTAKTISDTLADYIMSGGKDAAQYLKRLFATLVLQPVVQTVVGSVLGTGSGVAGAVSGGSNILGMASNVASVAGNWGAISGLVSGTMSLANAAGSIAANAAATTGAIDGLSALLATNGAYGTAAAAGGAAAGSGIAGTLAAIPGWGWALAGIAALGGILAGMDDSGTPHIGGSAAWSSSQGLRTNRDFLDDQEGLPGYNPNDNIDNQFGSGMPWVQDSEQVRSVLSTMAQSLGGALDGFARSFGQAAGYEVALGFADDSSKDGSWGALRIALGDQELLNWNNDRESRWAPRIFADGDKGWKEFLAEAGQGLRDVLLDMDLPEWADTMLESIGDAADMDKLSAVINQIAVVNTAFAQLGNSMSMFANISGELQTNLLNAAGGIDALVSSAGAFYQGFYSEAERMDALRGQINSALTGLDLTIDPNLGDDAKAQFRRAVEEAMAAGDAELAASLLAISGNFASAADYFQQISQSAADAAKKAAKDARKALIDSTYDLFRRAVDRDRDLLQGQASTISDVIGQISSSVQLLKSNARDLYGTVDSTRQMLAAQGMVYIEQALGGVRSGASVADYTGLSDAISAARGGISSGAYVSEFERQRDTLVLAGQLSELGDLGDLQLSVEERQLRAINEQLEYLDTLNRRADDLVNGTVELTGTVQSNFDQLMALLFPEANKKPGASGKGDAIAGFDGFSGIGSGGLADKGERIREAFTDADLSNLTDVAQTAWLLGFSQADIAAAYGVSQDDLQRMFEAQGIPKFASGGAFTNGIVTRPTFFDIGQMGERGSEAIMPLANIGGRLGVYAMGGGESNAELIAEMRALREEVAALRATASATQRHTAQLNDNVDRYTNGGNFSRQKAPA